MTNSNNTSDYIHLFFYFPGNGYLAKKTSIQLLKAYRIKFQKFAAHAHKDVFINETFIPT